MHIRYGYIVELQTAQPLPLVAMLDIHPSRRPDITQEDEFIVEALAPEMMARSLEAEDDGLSVSSPATTIEGTAAAIPVSIYEDGFGNLCRRLVLPAGGARLRCSGTIFDSGFPDAVVPEATESAPEDLPDDALVFLLPSRFCDTDLLMATAWELFGSTPPGWERVQRICDFVNGQITFGYHFARNTRTAFEAYQERMGVCRDFAHLAISLCRCLNIPARYCTGYLGDIGVPRDPNPMDFSAWFEVYLGGQWYTFDARHNVPRIGRILLARGRDAADVPIVNTFGPHVLTRFEVMTEEVAEPRFPQTSEDRRDHWKTQSSLGATG